MYKTFVYCFNVCVVSEWNVSENGTGCAEILCYNKYYLNLMNVMRLPQDIFYPFCAFIDFINVDELLVNADNQLP